MNMELIRKQYAELMRRKESPKGIDIPAEAVIRRDTVAEDHAKENDQKR